MADRDTEASNSCGKRDADRPLVVAATRSHLVTNVAAFKCASLLVADNRRHHKIWTCRKKSFVICYRITPNPIKFLFKTAILRGSAQYAIIVSHKTTAL